MEANFEVVDDGQASAKKISARAKLLVGADGVRSQVRTCLVGSDGDKPRDLYLNTWNAVIPTQPVR